ncbi:MAG: aldo/keto reductase [Anaerolineae bacterium]|nr:aldo/keto reductase [Anaerolineae bacterium]MDW8100331.1 aldo/keto reductase [Anaerolineae bacterium]
MKTVLLGHTGVQVSAICLGAMYFGTRNDPPSSYQLLDQYVEAGGSFIDTANIYAWWVPGFQGGESETLLGQWMRERCNRARLFLATKVGFQYAGVERGLRASQIEAECEKSLKRLGVETIDLYYAHVDDRKTPMEETLEAFDRLVRAGKVRFIGASNFLAWRLEEARWVSQTHGWAEYCCIQQRYTYLRPKPGASFDPQIAANEDLLDYCQTRGLTLLAYSPLLSGAYTRPDRPLPAQYVGPDSEARLAALKAVAAEVGATVNQVVLAWMIHSVPPVIPVIGASTPEQMRENLGALEVKLTEEHIARLNNASA